MAEIWNFQQQSLLSSVCKHRGHVCAETIKLLVNRVSDRGGQLVVDPGFGKGGFMRMCTVATTPPFDAHAHVDAMKVAAAVLRWRLPLLH